MDIETLRKIYLDAGLLGTVDFIDMLRANRDDMEEGQFNHLCERLNIALGFDKKLQKELDEFDASVVRRAKQIGELKFFKGKPGS